MSQGQPPWHMWGNTQVLSLPGFTIPPGDLRHFSSAFEQSQLVDVRYLRPDTFRFFLQAKLVEAPELEGGADTNATVEVDFDLITGIGRSNILVPSFLQLNFHWLGSEAAPIGVVLFSASGKGYQTWTSAALADPVDIAEVTAQSLQLQARARLVVNQIGSDDPVIVGGAAVSVSAHFAPNVHVRPEWHEERFDGGEQGVA